MNSLQTLSAIYVVIAWVLIALFLLLLISRSYNILTGRQRRKSFGEIKAHWYIKTLKILFGITMFTVILNAFFYGYIGSAFKALIPSWLNHLLIVTTVLPACWECHLAFSISEKLLQKKSKKIVLTILVVIFLPLSVSSAWDIPKMFRFPAGQDCYLIDLPVNGTWLASHAGSWQPVNAHQAVRAQWYAIDIVKVNDQGVFYQNEGKKMDDFYTFNEHVYAPVSGIVVGMVDSLPNRAVSFTPSDSVHPAGNHVVIEFEPNRYLFLAHLNYGTIEVERGDHVTSGDLVGKAGNSGNTSWPHLHMHIQDKAVIDNRQTNGYPFRFRELERKRWFGWTPVTNGFLIRNDLFRKPQELSMH